MNRIKAIEVWKCDSCGFESCYDLFNEDIGDKKWDIIQRILHLRHTENLKTFDFWKQIDNKLLCPKCILQCEIGKQVGIL